MSTNTTFRGRRLAAVAAVPLVLAVAGFAVPGDGASLTEPVPTYQRTLVPDDWPDEGSGYPGFADPPAARSTVPSRGNSLEATSVAVGAMGGIALGAAGLGIGLAVQRRRDHASASTI